MIYSTLEFEEASPVFSAALSSVLDGPVCVIGTTRSVFGATAGLRGPVIVSTPSDDSDD